MTPSANIMDQEAVSVSGLVVHINPKKLADVETNLNTITGVEVHAAAPEGKLVVTVEEQSGQKTMVDTITQISHVEGVISTALVYTHNDAWSEA
ncbi:chaperone NapD [Parendozoicomonas sp. Alg238-R29]|uniref:chaperone NapD n=1 Tax=Parendozoicomonas sp. Alg238-R29 TaxID=2993446 RepID=UPI00248D3DE3|nr:chaperone NapD [Parendozoicomonas sp. Alg238-R29]